MAENGCSFTRVSPEIYEKKNCNFTRKKLEIYEKKVLILLQ